jgi:hypothetical protein
VYFARKVRLNTKGKTMLKMLPFAAAATLFAISYAHAQTPACGVETWNQAEMKYVTTPCAGQTQKTADGKASCGPETWSQAEMKYVGTPCTAQAKQDTSGKSTCGAETWSQAEMRYVGVPCSHQ